MKQIPYQYKNMPIRGGGFVTGFVFSETEPDVLYTRTDIGGVYRYDAEKTCWKSLCDHVTPLNLSEAYPIAIALQEGCPGKLYIACGVYREHQGMFAVSEDYGEHFHYETIPVRVHGNLPGRSTGERLAVSGGKVYFASQLDGLLVSEDEGKHWTLLSSLPEQHLTFVSVFGDSILVGTAGLKQKADKNMRGHSLYVSYDSGEHFEKMPQPKASPFSGCRLTGLVAQRCACDGTYLYVTFAGTGRRSFVQEDGYGCDSGDVLDGKIVRYPLLPDGKFGDMEDITPGLCKPVQGIGWDESAGGDNTGSAFRTGKESDDDRNNPTGTGKLEFGFSGISVSRQTSGMLVATTIVKDDGDSVLLSMDYGDTWKQILYDIVEGEIRYRTSYLKAEYNSGRSFVHWMSDIKINPFNDSQAWFNTGTGVFRTDTLGEDGCFFTDWNDGLEETVHMNVYSLPEGDTQVIDLVGDLGGFAFEHPDMPVENTFSDGKGNRYITCMNADYAEENSNLLVVTARGNWCGMSKGGVIYSKDQGKTFERLPIPWGLSKELDKCFQKIEMPNVDCGWVAMSPDGKRIVWSVAKRIELPVSQVVVSHDEGRTFVRSRIYDITGREKDTGQCKVFSDRMDADVFYGFGEQSEIYLSVDGGRNFRQIPMDDGFPEVDFGWIDGKDKVKIRPESGQSGVFYLAMGHEGLWKILVERKPEPCARARRLTKKDDEVYAVGLGIGPSVDDYRGGSKTIYCNGIIEGTYGFYRSLDDGETYERINTPEQMYGFIGNIAGDSRKFGCFYLATGTRGLICGRPG